MSILRKMKANILILVILFIVNLINSSSAIDDVPEMEEKHPTILVAILVRNKAHTLPYFFSYLENLDYPKNRISLWIRSDHNADNSIELIHIWLSKISKLYHDVDFKYEDSPPKHHINETSPVDWPKERFSHMIQLKEDAFEKARQMWADFIFFLDADVFLTNRETLKHLTKYNLPIVAPMVTSEGIYSNYWCGMSSDYYYQRTDDYKKIYHYEKTGVFPVPMVHTAVLVNLKYSRSDLLTFDREKLIANQKELNTYNLYDGPLDDIIIFAIAANSSGLPLHVSNEFSFGYFLIPLEKEDELYKDYQLLMNIKTAIITDTGEDVKLNEEFRKFIHYPEKHKLSLDHIYMINLERRPERKLRMELNFRELGLDVEHFPAVDGRELNADVLRNLGITFLPGYEDPYHHRQMTLGEVGCFLSHYYIWKKMVELNQKEVLVLEDDIRFEPNFKEKAIEVLGQARLLKEWDLIYFGRKRLESEEENDVKDVDYLVYAGYSYWTLGYAISLKGAQKLLALNPLEKLVPVDEFLPIAFDRHPNETWSSHFSPRNLVALSAFPLLVYPSHYTGDDGYISDTEDSQITPVEDLINYDSSKGTVEGKFRNDMQKSEKNEKEFETFSPSIEDRIGINSKYIPSNGNHIEKSMGLRDSGEL